MQEKLDQVHKSYSQKIQQAISLKALDELYLALFGKSGEITLLPREFSKLPKDELKIIGPLFNQIKSKLEQNISNRREQIREEGYAKLTEEKVNLNQAIKITPRTGHLHPTTKFIQDTVDLFAKLGFQQFDAPHIDTDSYNFGLLNIPEGHPARDLWDTLYLDNKNPDSPQEKLLLRTHTSNAQVRIMRSMKPPIRMMSLGRCFRYENLDARHEHTFEQFELVYIDKGLNMANLQYLSEYFLKTMISEDVKVRLRPKYYPFVEPGVGIDCECIFCQGKGCKVCSFIGWLEVAGAGMIHPTVLKNGGIDPNIYSGIAWGPGVGRIMMLKHNFNDLRLLLKGDLSFLEKF